MQVVQIRAEPHRLARLRRLPAGRLGDQHRSVGEADVGEGGFGGAFNEFDRALRRKGAGGGRGEALRPDADARRRAFPQLVRASRRDEGDAHRAGNVGLTVGAAVASLSFLAASMRTVASPMEGNGRLTDADAKGGDDELERGGVHRAFPGVQQSSEALVNGSVFEIRRFDDLHAVDEQR